jgi:hypothetical protein
MRIPAIVAALAIATPLLAVESTSAAACGLGFLGWGSGYGGYGYVAPRTYGYYGYAPRYYGHAYGPRWRGYGYGRWRGYGYRY